MRPVDDTDDELSKRIAEVQRLEDRVHITANRRR